MSEVARTSSRKAPGELARGRAAFRERAWADANTALSRADQVEPLGAGDLELMAMSAALAGREDVFLKALERAHHAHLEAGEVRRAALMAFWLGLRLFFLGETGRATGWLARAERLVEGEGDDCAERGYLLVPVIHRHFATGEFDLAYAAAERAAALGQGSHDQDLIALARNLQGRARLRQGQIQIGLALLDEAMVAAAGEELSPIITALIYCSVIDGCQQVYAIDRARQWTAALAAWCEMQPQLVAFTGTCLVHRAEVMQLNGAWQDAIEEARRASARSASTNDRPAVRAAFYQEAEVLRLKGAFAAAEEAYRNASQAGHDPQPGLALLRLAQGEAEAAAGAIRRAVGAATDTLQRTRLLPAYVEIMLAVGDIEAARGAARELAETAAGWGTEVLGGIAAHASGAVALAEGDARGALAPLRHAFAVWQQVEAPYLAARIRELVGRACLALGDRDGAALELEGARSVYAELGAGRTSRASTGSAGTATAARPAGLTPRELQVLRSSPPARPTRRSPPSCPSARRPSTGM